MLKCGKCGMEVDCCQNPMCINGLHNSDSFTKGEKIFCNDGNHYCEKDCLVEEFRECGVEGEETEVIK